MQGVARAVSIHRSMPTRTHMHSSYITPGDCRSEWRLEHMEPSLFLTLLEMVLVAMVVWQLVDLVV